MKTIAISLFLVGTIFTTMQAQRGYVRDAIEDKYENKYMNDSSSALKQWMYGNLMNVKVAPSYIFPQSLTMQISTYKNEKLEKETTLETYLNSPQNIMGYRMLDPNNKKEDITSIFDYTQNAMISLNKTTMTGMAFSMNAFMSKETQDKLKESQSAPSSTSTTTCGKTGASKVIQGYKCEEYVCTNTEKNTKIVAWICPTLFSQNLFSSMFKNYSSNYNFPSAAGMALECYMYKGAVLETKLLVSNINKTANYTISTKEYKLNDFSGR